MKRILMGLFAVCLNENALAGIPFEEEIECPIGGEKFEIVSTMSCSTQGFTLHLKPLTSCDFVTRLPVCPSNGLPIYKEFSDEELALLPGILSSQTLQKPKHQSIYFRAYQIERILPGKNRTLEFRLLQDGLWYDGVEQTLDNEVYFEEYKKSFLHAQMQGDLRDREFWMASWAMLKIRSNETEEAKKIIELLRNNPNFNKPHFIQYLDALDYCVDNSTDNELCSLTTLISDHSSD